MHFVDIIVSDAKTNLIFNCFISMAFKQQRDFITTSGADETQSAEQIAKRSIIEAQEENLSHYEMSNLMPDENHNYWMCLQNPR